MVLLEPRVSIAPQSEAAQQELTEQRTLTQLNKHLFRAQVALITHSHERLKHKQRIAGIEQRVCKQVCKLHDATLARIKEDLLVAQHAVLTAPADKRDRLKQVVRRTEEEYKAHKAKAEKYRAKNIQPVNDTVTWDVGEVVIGALRMSASSGASGEEATEENKLLEAECDQLRQELVDERRSAQLSRALAEKQHATLQRRLDDAMAEREALEAQCASLQDCALQDAKQGELSLLEQLEEERDRTAQARAECTRLRDQLEVAQESEERSTAAWQQAELECAELRRELAEQRGLVQQQQQIDAGETRVQGPPVPVVQSNHKSNQW